ncbi:MAG TPA: peptidyl-prolyl cis-trans isomerase [Candidatus Methanoperedens sp.]|nr:peptidyl-prolyl cis-trans isomerase [Candidatus Methanoperedens sp.]
MMRFIRNNAVFVLVVVILIVAVFIGTIFLVWGRGSMSSSSSERSVAAWVGKTEIPYAEFVKSHDARLEFYRRFYPNMGAAELEKRFKIRKGALDAAIARRLLLDEAQRLGLGVGADEIGRKIRETAAFQVNAVFDPKKYREVLAASGITPTLYEEDVRGELLSGKVKTIVQGPVQISEAEAFEEYRRDREKVRLALVILPPAAAAPGAAVAAERLRQAYDADPAKYTLPERIQVACAAVRAQDLPAPPAASEDDLRRYFEENPAEFRIEKGVRARHILFKLAEDAPADEEKKIRERAEFVLGKARGGADFEALAKEFSQDSSGPAGGELGWFTAGQMVPEFEQAAFALGKGQVSEALVRTQFGFHIIKVEDTRAAGSPAFEQVRAQVAERAAAAARRAALAARVEQVNDALADGEFDAVAARFGLAVQTTGLVPREGPLPGAAARPDVAESLFGLGEGEVSEFIRAGEDFWVYKVLAKRASSVPSFEEARAQVERGLLAEDARERGLGEARLRLEELRRGEKPEALAARLKGEAKETAFFTQREFVAEAGLKGELFAAAFALEAGAFGAPVAAPDGRIVIYSVSAKVPATREGFDAEKSAVLERLRTAKRDRLFESWIEDLRRLRSVKVNTQLVGAL